MRDRGEVRDIQHMRALKPFRSTWKSFTVFRLFGVPVQFHSTWFVFLGCVVVLSGAVMGGWTGSFLGSCFLGLLVGSILSHEFAHVLAARKYGCETRRALVISFARIAELEAILLEAPEIVVAGAGGTPQSDQP
jgi:stage IV sporulation protein FB